MVGVAWVWAQEAERARITRKECRKETETILDNVRLPRRSNEPVADRDEITRLWLARRCFACRRCPRMVTRLARWHSGAGEG